MRRAWGLLLAAVLPLWRDPALLAAHGDKIVQASAARRPLASALPPCAASGTARRRGCSHTSPMPMPVLT